ncbi:MAG: tetratricopeptide repeat protein [Leptolinea sp.]
MKNQRYQKVMKQIHKWMQQDEWQKALDELRLAEKEFPDAAAILTAMGDCQIHLIKPEAAVEHFKRVTELEPASVEAFNNLGVAYMFIQNFTQAESAYLHALQYMPDHAQTLKNLAFLYYQQEDRLGDAATILAGLVRKYPTDCDALFLMGQCYEIGSDPASAAMCYERILVHQPDSKEAKEALDRINQR